jgi:septum formation protein
MDKNPIILASASPRRKELMLGLGYAIEVVPSNVEESFPEDLPLEKVPEYLAERKASSLVSNYSQRLIVAADTVVIVGENILNKPADANEAKDMLHLLSGKMHLVVTGVCICYQGQKEVFSDRTEVYFNPLTEKEIAHYVERFQPFDKAGAYGVQEWIGYIAVEKIIGSFYNVMGLPVSKVYQVVSKMKYHPFE